MCSYCLRDTCPPGCPNYEEDIVGVCEHCGGEIYVGQDHLDTDNGFLCDDCFDNMTRRELAEFLGATWKRGDACA